MMKIQRNEIHLWFVYDQKVADEGLLESYQALLCVEERARMQRFIYPKHRHQFLLTRALVRTVLAEYLDAVLPEELVFTKNSYGKPSIDCGDALPPIQYNLSHTEGLIVLAVSAEKEVGVDVEAFSRKADILKLAQRYFSPSEVEELMALDSNEHQKRFFDLWTLKEAYIKACGKGLAIPLKDFSFSFVEDKIEISFSPELNDQPENWRFWQFNVNEQYRLALGLNGAKEQEHTLVCKAGVPLKGFWAL